MPMTDKERGLLFTERFRRKFRIKEESEEITMTKIREYNINGTIILGCDAGYGNYKTVHTTFPTSVSKSDKKPALTEEYLEYEGAFYAFGDGHKYFVADKHKDEDNYILMLAAVAKELKARGLTKAKIHLAVGLPLKWLKAQMEEFRKYLLQNSLVNFRYRNEDYSVEIAGCTVMPQCYAAVAENLRDFTGLNMLLDLGNGTGNIMLLNNGKPSESKAWTEMIGVHQAYKYIHGQVMDETGVNLPAEILNNYLKYGRTDISSEYSTIMDRAAKECVKDIFDVLKEHDFNPDLMKLYVMGGGARLIEKFGEYDPKRTTFNHDIRANAKGFEYYCYMTLKSQNKRK